MPYFLYIRFSKRGDLDQVPPSQLSFLVYGWLNKIYVTKFIIYGITAYLFSARPNPNPSRPCAGLLKVDWYLYPPIFVAGGEVSILRVNFPVGFWSTGVVQIFVGC